MKEKFPPQNKVDTETLIASLKDRYQNLAPEKQVAFSLVASFFYVHILISPNSLPESVQAMLNLLDKMPLSDVSVLISTVAAIAGSIDGSRRIVTERLPFYNAYIQVFLLHRFDLEFSDDGEVL